MEGNIVAAYKTQWGTCLISDAAYAGKTKEELDRVRDDLSRTVRSILRNIASEKRENEFLRADRQEPVATEIPPEQWPEEWRGTGGKNHEI